MKREVTRRWWLNKITRKALTFSRNVQNIKTGLYKHPVIYIWASPASLSGMLPPFPHRSVGPLVVRAVRRRAASDVVEIPLCELPNICGILRLALAAAAAAAGVGARLRRGSAFVTTRTKNHVDHEGGGKQTLLGHDIFGGIEARARCSRA